MNDWMGKILRVNLTNKKLVSVIRLDGTGGDKMT